MNSFVTVDMGAAVILMSEEYARTRGQPKAEPYTSVEADMPRTGNGS